jgi:PAS domain S-box-containing protein
MPTIPPKLDPNLDGEAAKLIIAHARDYAIMTLTLDGEILSWSPGAEKIMGFSAEEAIGSNFGALFTESDRAAGEDRLELDRAWRDGRAEDSRWHVRRDGRHFWANGVTMAFADGPAPTLIKVIRDETKNRLAEEQRILLLNELNHRINNTLVTVQSLVEQTLRAMDADRTLREELTARLQALSQAHAALMERNWASAELSDLVGRAAAAYRATGEHRFTIEGPPVRLSPQQAVSFSLALHELATNAVKYGALSAPEGFVAVSWNQSIDGDGARRMTFLWTEQGGPLVTPPSRRGFGSRLLERSFPEGSGAVEMEFLPQGLRCTIVLKLSTDAEQPMLDLAAAAG